MTDRILTSFILIFLVSCSGGSDATMMVIQSPNSPEHPIVWDTATPESVNMSETKLDAAFDYAFAEGTFTQSAVVIKDGKLIYERYRGILPGEANAIVNTSTLDNNTLQNLFAERDSRDPTSSWSSAKSFTSFLIGIAELDGLISSIDDSAAMYITEWANDERADITIKNLLDMRSGLVPMCFDFTLQNLHECKNRTDSASGGDIVFADNQLDGCINRSLAESGVLQPWFSDTDIYNRGDFLYSNCDTMVLGEIIYRATGQDIQTYAEQKLFSKIYINAAWWKDFVEFGQSNGNVLAYCCLDTTARDFAKFGYMLLLGGVWEDGNVSYSSYVNQIRNLDYYGLQFWKICAKPLDQNGNCPNNVFIHSTIGFDGQYIMIDFNRNIVVVRNSLYAPILNLSNERKMRIEPNNINGSNWILTLPQASGAPINTSFNASRFFDLVTQAIEQS